jgi:hypothetical protein
MGYVNDTTQGRTTMLIRSAILALLRQCKLMGVTLHLLSSPWLLRGSRANATCGLAWRAALRALVYVPQSLFEPSGVPCPLKMTRKVFVPFDQMLVSKQTSMVIEEVAHFTHLHHKEES